MPKQPLTQPHRPVGPGSTPRGRRRRDQLESTGVLLLAEGGWPAVTARGIAERAGTRMALIHYYYSGLPGLRHAVACRAAAGVVRGFVMDLTNLADPRNLLTVLEAPGHDREAADVAARLSAELISGSLRDEDIRAAVVAELRRARAEVARWVAGKRPGWSDERADGAAVLITALLDGLAMQLLIDPELDLAAAKDLLAAMPPDPGH